MKVFLLIALFQIGIMAEPLTLTIEDIATKNEKEVVPTVLMIDDFEDGEFKENNEWWLFGKVLIAPKTIEQKEKYLGNKSMAISASSNNWYAGGIGLYIGKEAHYFGTLKLVIFSPKINSGSIRIELYDDDNNNSIVDINDKTGLPSKDDFFIYDLNLTWEGWKVVTIPISEFIDFNENVGDNTWNPNQQFGSAGLLQIQLIILSSKEKSETIAFDIDTIKFNI